MAVSSLLPPKQAAPAPPLPAASPAMMHTLKLSTLRRDSAGRTLAVGIAERRGILVLGDLLALGLSLVLVGLLVPKPSWLLSLTTPDRMVTVESALVLGALWLVATVVTDSYDLTLARNKYFSPLRAGGVALAVHVVYPLVPIIAPPMLKSTFVWASLTLSSIIAAALWRLAYAVIVSRHPVMTLRALVIGDGASGRLIAETLHVHPGSGHQPIAFVSDGHASTVTVAGLPVIGTLDELPRVLEQTGVDELVVATDGTLSPAGVEALTLAYESGVRVTPMVTLYEWVTSQTPVKHIGENWLTVMPRPGEGSAVNAVLKRGLDLLGSVVGLLVLALLAAPIGLAIAVESRGSVLFAQERIGRGGKRFRIYKFRTFPLAVGERHARALPSIWDRKVMRPTRVGRWLRRLRLDELPQFWNVLRGEMSLVGPRPFVPEDVEELQQHIPFFRARHLVTPGLTGWAQVRGVYGTTLEHELEKLQYDLYYIRHQSMAFDLAILIKTAAVLLRLAGR